MCPRKVPNKTTKENEKSWEFGRPKKKELIETLQGEDLKEINIRIEHWTWSSNNINNSKNRKRPERHEGIRDNRATSKIGIGIGNFAQETTTKEDEKSRRLAWQGKIQWRHIRKTHQEGVKTRIGHRKDYTQWRRTTTTKQRRRVGGLVDQHGRTGTRNDGNTSRRRIGRISRWVHFIPINWLSLTASSCCTVPTKKHRGRIDGRTNWLERLRISLVPLSLQARCPWWTRWLLAFFLLYCSFTDFYWFLCLFLVSLVLLELTDSLHSQITTTATRLKLVAAKWYRMRLLGK